MISFSSALLVFFAVLTTVYLILLLKSEKSRDKSIILLNKIGLKIILLIASVLLVLLFIFERFMNTSVIYFLLYPIIVFLILITLVRSSDSNKTYLLVLSIFLHLMVLSVLIPSSGIMMTERTPALVELSKAKSWNTEWELLNPYYNPFPMDLGFIFSFSQITSIDFTAVLSEWAITLFFIIGFDLVVFSISKELGGSWKAGILGILILSFTPTANLNIQPQFIANFFVFVFALVLLKSLKNSSSIPSIIIANFIFAISILVHGTTAIALVFTFILFIFLRFGRSFGFNIQFSAHYRSFVYSLLTTIITVTFTRWIIVGGVEPVIFPLQRLINDIFGAPELTWIGSEYVPLYDVFVSPLLSYAWCIPFSLGIAFVLYHLIKRSQKKSLNVIFGSSLSLTAAILAFAGFVGGVFMAHGNLQRYLGYAGMTLFLPVAAVVCAKILRSHSQKIVSVCLISLVLFSGIAIYDPAFSQQIYSDLSTVNATRSADFVEGGTLYGVLSEKVRVVSTYEILTAFSYLNLVSEPPNRIGFYAGSLKVHRIYAANLTETKEAIPGVIYILRPDVLTSLADAPVNVIYSSGRHVAVAGVN